MTPHYAALAAVLAALLLGFAGGWGAQGWRSDARVSALQAEAAQARAAQTEDARLRERAARAEEQRRTAAQKEITDAATRHAQALTLARRTADDAGQRLREHIARLAARAAAHDPGPAADCAPASDAARVLADLLGRVESAGRAMAAIADERGAAGAACAAHYDSLTTTPRGHHD